MSNSAARRAAVNRREFLGTGVSAAALLGAGGASFLSRLPSVTAAEATAKRSLAAVAADVEPLVRLIEETPREKLLEEVGVKVRTGTAYGEVLAALQLAGVRNIQPRPNVGFKFHAVLVVNSAHLASLASPDSHRWLPMFWSLDYFKSAQALNAKEGGWAMGPVDEAAVPAADKARKAFIDAMDNWDVPAADAAVAGLGRSAGLNEIYELMWWYGARDFRSIGHKAIFVANSFRTLQAIGTRHAEPILRSLAYALLNHEGDNPAKRDGEPDRPGRRNLELADKFPASWLAGRRCDKSAAEMVAVIRTGSDEDAVKKVVELLTAGVCVQSIWDGVFTAAGELLMRQPGIVALHSETTANALRFAFDTAVADKTRRLMLLQAASFLPLFRKAAEGRGKLRELDILKLEPLTPTAKGPGAIEEIFADAGKDRMTAARKVLGLLSDKPVAKEFMDAARLLIFAKGTDSHDYKFSSAALEDHYHCSPFARARFLAAAMFQLRGSGGPDNGLVKRIRAALG